MALPPNLRSSDCNFALSTPSLAALTRSSCSCFCTFSIITSFAASSSFRDFRSLRNVSTCFCRVALVCAAASSCWLTAANRSSLTTSTLQLPRTLLVLEVHGDICGLWLHEEEEERCDDAGLGLGLGLGLELAERGVTAELGAEAR
jgi:hypothetical protein